ncbi:Cacna1i [Symbiodinium sp. CCMP2592]|nr:Cacna1i [Symbiodinium sp. CCMP2592]
MWRRLVAAVLALPALHADDGLSTTGKGGTTVYLKSEDCPVGMAVFLSSTLPRHYDALKLADALMKTPVTAGDEKARDMAAREIRAANKFLLAMSEETVVRGAEIGVKADWMTGQCACAGAVTRGRLLGLLFSYVHDVLLMIGLNFHVPDPTPANLLLICNPEGSTSFQPPRIQWADFLATSSGESTRGLLAGTDREIADKVEVFFGSIMFAAQHPDLASVQQIADVCVARLESGLKEGLTLCMERVWSEQQKMSSEELHDFRRFVAGEILFNEIDALSARHSFSFVLLACSSQPAKLLRLPITRYKLAFGVLRSSAGTTSTSVVWVRELARNKDSVVSARGVSSVVEFLAGLGGPWSRQDPEGEDELERAFQVLGNATGCPWLKLMDFVSGLRLVQGAISSNFWGLGCPLYCTQPSVALLLLTFVIGLLSGLCLAAYLCFHFGLLGREPPSQSPARVRLQRMQSGAESRTSLVVHIGGCSVAIEGPLDSALSLAEHLRLRALLGLVPSFLCVEDPWIKDRIRRAWRAGAWFYVAVGGGGHPPGLYRNFRDYSRAVGPFPESTAVSHGFPSELVVVYEHPAFDGDGAIECLAVAVLKRGPGLAASMDAVVGPAHVLEVPGALLSATGLAPSGGRSVQITLVDLSVEALGRLSPYELADSPELLVAFDVGAPDLVPDPEATLAAAQAWIADPDVAALERVTFRSSSTGAHRCTKEGPAGASPLSAKGTPIRPTNAEEAADVEEEELAMGKGIFFQQVTANLALGAFRRMEVAYQLTFLEEPPSSMFMARAGPSSRARAFAPLASQKWVSVILTHLRELDTIQARRSEQTRPSRPQPATEQALQQRGPITSLRSLKFTQHRAIQCEIVDSGYRRANSAVPVSDAHQPLGKHGKEHHDTSAALRDEAAKSFGTTITFGAWASALPRWLLRAHTPFSAYLAMSFVHPASRCGNAPATATFPLPWPHLGVFGRASPDLPRAQKQRLILRRTVHIVVAALNFLHDCGRWAHSLLCSCVFFPEEFPLPPGRSGPDLVARLLELESFAGAFAHVGSSGSSDLLSSFGAVPSVPLTAELPQLQPYRSLDVSRIRLHGSGHWLIAPFLEGPLWLPFQEPGILRHGLPLGTNDLPDFAKESAEEHLKLALLWDAKGLLHLAKPLQPEAAYQRSCRIFNSYEAIEADRQIGDRRPSNRAELHLEGPSKFLPQGSLLTSFRLKRRRQQLIAYVSDRRDFYHQVSVTEARADTNRLPFEYAGAAFADSAALLPLPRVDRRGDHLGVEFALEGHSQLLLSCGALRPSMRMQGSSALPLGSTWQALVIDDLVNLSALPAGAQPGGLSEASGLRDSGPKTLWKMHIKHRRSIAQETQAPESRECSGGYGQPGGSTGASQKAPKAREASVAKILLCWCTAMLAAHRGSRAEARQSSWAIARGSATGRWAVPHSLGWGHRRETSEEAVGPPPGFEAVPASLPFVLDLLEIGDPSGPVSVEASRLGLRVGPPIHPAVSEHYATQHPYFATWLYAVLKEGKVRSLVLHSPRGLIACHSRAVVQKDGTELGLLPLAASSSMGSQSVSADLP